MIHLILSFTYCNLNFVIMIVFEDMIIWFLKNPSNGVFVSLWFVFRVIRIYFLLIFISSVSSGECLHTLLNYVTSRTFQIINEINNHFRIIVMVVTQYSFIHSVFCLTTGPKPPPKRCLHIVRCRASSFKWEYPLLSLRSFSSFLHLLPRLLATSISPFIFPSITWFRRQFL